MKLTKLIPTLIFSVGSLQAAASEPIEPIMVTIPAGSFDMGSTKRRSTQPVHKVTLPEFSMGKYEVTVTEFRRFVEATNYEVPQECRHEMDSWFLLWTKGNWETNALNTSEFQPVVCINWQAANAYVEWLAKETGKPYRLPSEAEWEYAARAGTKTDYFFGDDPDKTKVCEYANTSDLSGENILQRDSGTSYYNFSGPLANCTDYAGYASIVGMYKPNQFGLHDMLSNVLEFLADCYDSYENVPNDGSAHIGGSCERRVTRGGSWHWSHWPLWSRSNQSEDFSGGVDGFRLALDGKAPKRSKATKQFAASLTFAQTQEQKRRDASPSIPEPVVDVKLQQSDNSVILSWTHSEHSDNNYDLSYRVYRNGIEGGMFTLLANNITDTRYIDANASPNKYEYTIVAVKNNLQSYYSEPVATQVGWADIQDKIEAEWAFDFKGSRASYSEDDDRRGKSLQGILEDTEIATLKYQIDVQESGHYELEYRVATPANIEGFEVYIDDKKAGSSPLTTTGSDRQYQTQPGISLYLPKGKHTLTLKSRDNDWKLNWFALKPS